MFDPLVQAVESLTWSQLGDCLIGKPLAIAGLFAGAVILRWFLKRLLNRIVHQLDESTEKGRTAGGRRLKRVRSLASLGSSLATVLLFGIATVMALSLIGVNIAPILASAGVVGVAIGFGAQSLVKDLLSGIAMMIEDQYGVGDWIQLDDIGGNVEEVGLRVTRLRDTDGTVWYVRNGEINRVGNQSQDWARTVLDISVSYEEDLDEVQDHLREVASELWRDDQYSGVIIEEPEVWGVQSMTTEAVVVRVTLKTAPLEQWRIARAMRERIRNRFSREGIKMPQPQRILWQQMPPKSKDDAASESSE